ncbi:HEAT repeat domain-containing protein [Sphingosinicella sp.]|uniref:HEAT repeat domain-containing protein n=1 Tax=Sphingosinicella sp. TaxID=1917971 RepID=UPI004037C100
MIIDAELRGWLDDRVAHRTMDAAARRFAHDWSGSSPHLDFDAVMAALGEADAETFAEAARALLADEAWVDALVARLAAEMRTNACFEPPFRALRSDIHSGLLVYEDDHLTIAAGVSRLSPLAERKQIGKGKGSIQFSGQIGVLRFLKAGGLSLAFWECDPIDAGFSAASAGECWPVGARRIADGETIIVDGRHQSYIIEQAAANFIVLQANLKTGQAPVSVEYDAGTRCFIGCSAVDEGDCRIQMVATLARTLGHEEAFAAIAGFLDHPSFFVRWHAMKELLGIDLATTLPHLKRMAARDPHPDPRAAARMVLDRIEYAPGPRKAA